jgi:oxaloacetate decarboxylase gamma subunit
MRYTWDMSALMKDGFELMMAGMGTVFFFLTVLVATTWSMSWLINRFSPAPDPSVVTEPQAAQVAAITAAIAAHRERQAR